MSGVTVVVEDAGSEEIAGRVIESSRKLYTKKVVQESDESKTKAPSKSKSMQSPTKKPPQSSGGLGSQTSLK